MNLIDSHASLQSSHSCKLNTVAWVVVLTYLHVFVKCESLLGGHGMARCTVTRFVREKQKLKFISKCLQLLHSTFLRLYDFSLPCKLIAPRKQVEISQMTTAEKSNSRHTQTLIRRVLSLPNRDHVTNTWFSYTNK